jgi:hypothetical protein
MFSNLGDRFIDKNGDVWTYVSHHITTHSHEFRCNNPLLAPVNLPDSDLLELESGNYPSASKPWILFTIAVGSCFMDGNGDAWTYIKQAHPQGPHVFAYRYVNGPCTTLTNRELYDLQRGAHPDAITPWLTYPPVTGLAASAEFDPWTPPKRPPHTASNGPVCKWAIQKSIAEEFYAETAFDNKEDDQRRETLTKKARKLLSTRRSWPYCNVGGVSVELKIVGGPSLLAVLVCPHCNKKLHCNE